MAKHSKGGGGSIAHNDPPHYGHVEVHAGPLRIFIRTSKT